MGNNTSMNSELYTPAKADVMKQKLFDWTMGLCDNRKGSYNVVEPNDLGMRGISVHYLSTEFLKELQNENFSESSKIYEIEENIIRKKGVSIICPRDGRLGAAYVDSVSGKGNIGTATHMLSYTWGYSVNFIVSSLKEFCSENNLDPKKKYIWICCLCINQHRVVEAQAKGITIPFHEFQETFESRVLKIGKVIALMAPWNNPTYLSRIWCVFEMYHALQKEDDVMLSIVMPPEEKIAFGKALEEGTGELEDVYKVLGTVLVENAQASVKEDQENILKIIREGPGYHTINSGVSQKIMSWFLSTAKAYAYDLLKAGGMSNHCPRVVAKIGDLLMEANYRKDALDLFDEGVRVARSNGTINTADGAYLLLIRGVLHRWEKHLDTALENFLDSRKIFEKVGAWRSADGGTCLRQIALVKEANGDLEGALLAMEESKEFRLETNTLRQQQGANLLSNMSRLYRTVGRHKEADEYLVEAYKIFEEVDIMSTSDGCNINFAIGDLHRRNGNKTKALEFYKKGIAIREKIQTIRSPKGAEQLEQIANLLVEMGKEKEAKEYFEKRESIMNAM